GFLGGGYAGQGRGASLRQDRECPELSLVGAVQFGHLAQADHSDIEMAAENVGPLRCRSAIGDLVWLDAGSLREHADGQMAIGAGSVMSERDRTGLLAQRVDSAGERREWAIVANDDH